MKCLQKFDCSIFKESQVESKNTQAALRGDTMTEEHRTSLVNREVNIVLCS